MLDAVNIDSNVPVYEQIENQVRFAIAAGELKPEDQLPTVRELADRIGVNFNTVAKAYRDLEVMGLVTGRRGMGFFVNKGVHARVKQECRTKLVDRLHEVVSEAKAVGLGKKSVMNVVSKSLASGAGPYSGAPPEVINAIKKK